MKMLTEFYWGWASGPSRTRDPGRYTYPGVYRSNDIRAEGEEETATLSILKKQLNAHVRIFGTLKANF